MPVNWSDPMQVQKARQAAIDNGLDAVDVDSYIKTNTMSAPKVGSDSQPDALPDAPNQIVLPKMKTQGVLPTPDALLPGVENNALLDIAKQKKSAELSTPQQSQPQEQKPYDPTGKAQAQVMAETGRQSELDQMKQPPQPPAPVQQTPPAQVTHGSPLPQQPTFQAPKVETATTSVLPTDLPRQGGILPAETPITQHAGNYNPNVEVFSKGYARDTNFRAKPGTPVGMPEGNWVVEQIHDRANPVGGLHNGENQGYGNMVKARNADTGEYMIFQHLNDVNAQPGQKLPAGTVIGHTGASGNVTGPNLGIEYGDKSGKILNVENSPYAKSLFGQSSDQSGQSSQQQPPAPQPAPQSTPLISAQPTQPDTVPTQGSAAPGSKEEAFIQQMSPYADQVEKQYGIPKAVTLAQAGLESGFNPNASTIFGIKGSGNAGTFNTPTKEDYGNGMVNVNDNFAKYNSTGDAFDAYGKLLTTNPRYASVVDAAKSGDKQAVVEAIKNSGYATDPAYVNKVMGIINRYGL